MNWGGASAPLFYCTIHVSRSKLPLGRILHPAGVPWFSGECVLRCSIYHCPHWPQLDWSVGDFLLPLASLFYNFILFQKTMK
jgi:hypothetical protein